jgi:hypothetical protein
MRSIRRIMLEQARASRERADFYRQLARNLGPDQAATFEKSWRELEERATEMERYARWFMGSGEGDVESSDGNVVGKLQRAIALALTTPKKLD